MILGMSKLRGGCIVVWVQRLVFCVKPGMSKREMGREEKEKRREER